MEAFCKNLCAHALSDKRVSGSTRLYAAVLCSQTPHLCQVVGNAFSRCSSIAFKLFVSTLEQLGFGLTKCFIEHLPKELQPSWASVGGHGMLFNHIPGLPLGGEVDQHGELLGFQAIETLLGLDGPFPLHIACTITPELLDANGAKRTLWPLVAISISLQPLAKHRTNL